MKIKIDKEDKAASQIKREANPYCAHCGKKEHLAVHHLFSRGHSATRYIMDNLIVLCPSCHTFSPTFSAHRTEQTFKVWAKKRLGAKKYNALEKLSNTTMSRAKAKKEFWSHYKLS